MTINGSTNHSLWNFKLEAYEESYSINNNTSRVVVHAYIGRNTSASYMWGAEININVSVTSSGTKGIYYYNASQVNVGVGEWIDLGSTYFDVPHNADGSKGVTVSASFTNNVSPANGSANGYLTLTTIPRATTPTLSVSTAILGQTEVKITTKGASSTFTHKLKYTIGNSSGNISNNTWIPSIELAKEFPNSRTGKCMIICETYSGSSKIGEKSVVITLKVADDVVPVIGSVVLSEVGSDMSDKMDWGVYVQAHSRLKIIVTTTPGKGSNIKSCTIIGLTCELLKENNGVYEFVSNTLTNSGNLSFSVVVKDERSSDNDSNTYATYVKTYNVVSYSIPVIEQDTEALRCESVNKITEDGEYLLYTFKGHVSEVSGKNNHVTYIIKYKEVGSTSDYNKNLIKTGAFSINTSPTMLPNYTFLNTKRYEIVFSITDSFTTTEKTIILGTVPDLINFNPSGKSMAFGTVSQASESETRLDIALDTNFTKSVTINGEEVGSSFEII